MHYIEDLAVAFMMLRVRVSTFDEKIARSLGTQAFEKRPYTQKQSEIVLRLLKKYRQQFIKQGYTYIDTLLENPVFAHPIRHVDQTKHVSLDHNKKCFLIKFPYSQEIVNKLRETNQKNKLVRAQWEPDDKIWTLELNEESINFIITDLLPKQFTVDEDTSNFIEQFDTIQKNFENYIPMLIKQGDEYTFKNINLDFKSNNLMEALSQSAKAGVHVFDDTVSQELTNLNNVRPITKIFSHIDKQKFYVNREEYTRNDLISLVKEMNTVNAVFLYEETTDAFITQWVEDLTNIGVSLEEIAVYFRRKNDEEGIKFNKTVKNLGLNKEADDPKVKWMFFGAKYPKVLIKNKKIADVCICENRYVSTHHTVISTVKNSMFSFYPNDYPLSGDDVVKL